MKKCCITKYLRKGISILVICCMMLSGFIFEDVEKVYAKNIVVYSQTDSRWANSPYGLDPKGNRATISSAGCGILSYVNAVYYMTGNFISPIELANWSVNHGHRINGVGTSFGLYKAYADAYGMKYGFKYAGSAVNVSETKAHLKNGGTAIISVPGHLMALVDYNESSNKYLILDSYKSSNRGTYAGGYRWLTASEFTEKLAVSAIRLISPISGEAAHNPVGKIDSLTGRTNSITIGGWAFDEDALSKSLEIHVYIGGEAGSGASCHIIKANKARRDVESAYPGVGVYHGFEDTITTNRTGTQSVYVYAINTGGGSNVLLGSRTVTIKDGKNPIGALDNVTSGEGYINVSGWAFDEDDLSKSLEIHVYIGGEAGSGAPCYVIKADKERADVGQAYPNAGNYHGYNTKISTDKTGKQKVYVYAINTGGGLQNPLLGYKEVTITEKPKVYAVEDVTILDENGYMCTHMWIDTIGNSVSLQAEILPKNATNKKVTWTTSDPSVITVDSKGTVTAVGSGAAYVIATTEDGKHASKCWVKTGWENIVYGDIDFNDKITATDLSVINKVINGTLTLTEAEKIIVDVDGDGAVTEADKDLINQYILKEIDSFPVEKMLSEIKITKLPDKLSYFKGDVLTTSGMEITAVYHNGSRKTVTGYSTSGNLNTVGKQKITVVYSEAGITRMASYDVQVDEILLDRITILEAPDKTSYIQGERFDPSGMVVQAEYNNGTTKLVENYTIEKGDYLSKGQNNVKLFYQERDRGKSVYQKITVMSRCEAYEHMWKYETNRDGTHLKECGECGEEYTQQCELKTAKVGASCMESGYIEEYCELCGYSAIVEMEEMIAHTYDEGIVTKEATCGSAGVKTYICSYCEHSYGETIPATNLHTWNDGVITKKPTENSEGVKTYTCLICQKTKSESIPKKKETETENQECVHDISRREIRNAVSATCTKDGYSGDVYCKDCNKEIESGIIIEAVGHVYKSKILKKASPGKNGKEQITCKVCKETAEAIVCAPKKVLLSKSSYTYSGKGNQPSVTVLDTNGNKISSKYYSVSYKNNKNVGKATIIVKFKGKYSGNMKALFTIKPKTISSSLGLSGKSKGIVVKWEKQITQTTGYQIQYSTSNKFPKKSTQTVTINKNKTTSKKISKLKANQKYYVRMRTYKNVRVNGNSTKVYSDWSKVKSVRTKK